MKQMFLPIMAIVFTGVFSDVDNAVNAAIPGGGKQFGLDENQNEDGATLSFTDSKGTLQTAKTGDAVVLVVNEGGTPTGIDLLPAHVASTLVSEVPAAAPAAAADTTGTAAI